MKYLLGKQNCGKFCKISAAIGGSWDLTVDLLRRFCLFFNNWSSSKLGLTSDAANFI